MKRINLLIIGIAAMFGFMVSVSAANGVSLTCDKTQVKIGESSNCVVSITSESPVSAATITLSTSEYLIISNIRANTTAGWSASSAGTSGNNYAFNNTTGSTGGQVFSFNVTLAEAAKNLSETDDCGQLCISAATFNGNVITGIIPGTGTCFAPVIVDESCVGEDCNPKTGDFMNYAVIGVVGVFAVAAIVIARKSAKFYRV